MEKLKTVEHLEDSLSKLPGVGRKSAERIAYAMLEMPKEDLESFIVSIEGVMNNVHHCKICGSLSEDEICSICKDETRDRTSLMVVSYPKDVLSIERSEGYHGLYHVINGEISINKGITLSDLHIDSLLERLENEDIKEVILATNPTIEGETTALYIAKLLAEKDIKVTRLAYGLQMGGNLDYTDQLTLVKALEGRHKI